ncbi:hypothetical protein [Halobacteriovorax sp. HLS]|uniref:hypothetical protein n=1 Tax=Halobacteriovorax sp. HLS TaxID=2234000 RepID=UPI000FD96983|nr:hypothetical protein [Halobacteriovorax sp. HLS]
MGLMYMFPVSEDEQDRIDFVNTGSTKSIVLKTYGLPLVFWGYLIAILAVIGAMYLAVQGPIRKLIETGDSINIYLAYTVQATLIILPLTLIALYFYEKLITKSKESLIITHRVFWIPIWKKVIELKDSDSVEINHFMDSPNVAKMRKDASMKGFENKGYYELYATNSKNQSIFVDRHSRKADMVKMRDLLRKY